jgi:hypothetical protein
MRECACSRTLRLLSALKYFVKSHCHRPVSLRPSSMLKGLPSITREEQSRWLITAYSSVALLRRGARTKMIEAQVGKQKLCGIEWPDSLARSRCGAAWCGLHACSLQPHSPPNPSSGHFSHSPPSFSSMIDGRSSAARSPSHGAAARPFLRPRLPAFGTFLGNGRRGEGRGGIAERH